MPEPPFQTRGVFDVGAVRGSLLLVAVLVVPMLLRVRKRVVKENAVAPRPSRRARRGSE